MGNAARFVLTISSLVGAQLVGTAQNLAPVAPTRPPVLLKPDRDYLTGVARDTWHCIAGLVAPESGLPYDNSDKNENTSTSNIGMYLSCVAVADKMGFITHDDAEKRIDTVLTSLSRLQTYHGFQQCWNSVKTLEPGQGDRAVSILDNGNLAAGLITVAQAEPKFAERCHKAFRGMSWSYFYDPDQRYVIGGFDTDTGTLERDWHLDALATDAELAIFMSIAAGRTPVGYWATLNRRLETRCEITYFWPGWDGGGLFMQYVSGLWLDNQGTQLGVSADNFAAAQMAYAKQIGSPVWGWTSSDDPAGGYLGWGHLKDQVVSPHACTFASGAFPKDVVENLREFEALGVRSPDDGFYDSYDVKTQKHSRLFLLWDQGMMLLSLANYLDDNVVRKWFQSDPVVKTGRDLIPEFRNAVTSR